MTAGAGPNLITMWRGGVLAPGWGRTKNLPFRFLGRSSDLCALLQWGNPRQVTFRDFRALSLLFPSCKVERIFNQNESVFLTWA